MKTAVVSVMAVLLLISFKAGQHATGTKIVEVGVAPPAPIMFYGPDDPFEAVQRADRTDENIELEWNGRVIHIVGPGAELFLSHCLPVKNTDRSPSVDDRSPSVDDRAPRLPDIRGPLEAPRREPELSRNFIIFGA